MFWRSVWCPKVPHQSPALRICISASAGVGTPPCFQKHPTSFPAIPWRQEVVFAPLGSGHTIRNTRSWAEWCKQPCSNLSSVCLSCWADFPGIPPCPDCWGEGSRWLVGTALSRRTWEKLWISDSPPQDSAMLIALHAPTYGVSVWQEWAQGPSVVTLP